MLNQQILAYYGDAKDPTIVVRSHPFPFTAKFRTIADSFSAVSASIIIMIAFSFVPASIASFVVKEKEIAAKHQQIISGASLGAYWTSMYAWDITMYIIPWSFTVILVSLFGISSFQGENLFPIAVLFFGYGLAVTPFTYCLSYFFKSHSAAQNSVLLLNFVTGLVSELRANCLNEYI